MTTQKINQLNQYLNKIKLPDQFKDLDFYIHADGIITTLRIDWLDHHQNHCFSSWELREDIETLKMICRYVLTQFVNNLFNEGFKNDGTTTN